MLSSAGNITHVKFCRTGTSEIPAFHKNAVKNGKQISGFLFFIRSGTIGNNRITKIRSIRYLDLSAIKISTFPFCRLEHFISKRIVNNSKNDLAFFIKSQCHSTHMKITDQIGGSVNRIKDPVGFLL